MVAADDNGIIVSRPLKARKNKRLSRRCGPINVNLWIYKNSRYLELKKPRKSGKRVVDGVIDLNRAKSYGYKATKIARIVASNSASLTIGAPLSLELLVSLIEMYL